MKDNSFHFYTGVTLWIPRAAVPAYERAEGWRCFDYSHLTSALRIVESSGEPHAPVLFDLQGRPLPEGSEPRGACIEVLGTRSRVVVR